MFTKLRKWIFNICSECERPAKVSRRGHRLCYDHVRASIDESMREFEIAGVDAFFYRNNAGRLAESLADVRIFKSKAELVQSLGESFNESESELIPEINESTVHIKFYTYDNRIGWPTHKVTIDNYGLVGFTNKLPE